MKKILIVVLGFTFYGCFLCSGCGEGSVAYDVKKRILNETGVDIEFFYYSMYDGKGGALVGNYIIKNGEERIEETYFVSDPSDFTRSHGEGFYWHRELDSLVLIYNNDKYEVDYGYGCAYYFSYRNITDTEGACLNSVNSERFLSFSYRGIPPFAAPPYELITNERRGDDYYHEFLSTITAEDYANAMPLSGSGLSISGVSFVIN